MSTSRYDDFFDPARLEQLWTAAPQAAEAEAEAQAQSAPAPNASALIAKLQRALQRDLGPASTTCEPFLKEAAELCAALPDPVAQAELDAVLDGLEDFVEASLIGPTPGGMRRG